MNDKHIESADRETQYREMASDAAREHEAEEWIEGLIGDVFPEE